MNGIGGRLGGVGLSAAQNDALQKIDGPDATDGLLGTSNSLAYRIGEVERHLHHWERWLQLAGTPTDTHKAVGLGDADGAGPFIMDAGNDDWGAWVQILGADDTPIIVGSVKMDPHLILVTNTERNATYFLQIGFGATGAAALSAGTYTETVFQPVSNQIDSGPVTINSRRVAVGSLMWCRVMCPGQDTATLSAYFGGHEYEG
jgi:hypothetical protein